MREWLVIEATISRVVFGNPDAPKGYIPRKEAEELLGRDLGGMVWFTDVESAKMRAHPDWRYILLA